MRKKDIVFSIFISANLLLAGCWDQDLLAQKKIVNGIALDVSQENKMLGTARALNIQSKGGGQFEINDELVQEEGISMEDIGEAVDRKLPGELDAGRAHIILIGEELAAKGITSIIDPVYRKKKGYVNAKILVAKGTAYDVISAETVNPIAFEILQTIEGAERKTYIPKETVFTAWTNILEPGKDILLPLVEKVDQNKVEAVGAALFSGEKFSGATLSVEQTQILLLLMDKLNKISQFSLNLSTNKNEFQPITFITKSVKRQYSVEVNEKSKSIKCKLKVKLNVIVSSFPQKYKRKIDINALNKAISKKLSSQANEITDLLIQSNSDPIGIGRTVESKKPSFYKGLNWEEAYQNVEIIPSIEVNIKNTGNVF
ncbi:MAG: Ger(x)C family spore germination protein [Bacillota bacterium]